MLKARFRRREGDDVISRDANSSRITAIQHAHNFSVVNGINVPPGRCDGCFDSRYWNSIDGEKILIISPVSLCARGTMKLKGKKIKWAIKWNWDRSKCRLEKDYLACMWTFIHIYVNFYLHWRRVYLLELSILFSIYFI